MVAHIQNDVKKNNMHSATEIEVTNLQVSKCNYFDTFNKRANNMLSIKQN